jgi:hypothetical protein
MKVHNLELFHETNKNTSKFRQRSSAKAKPYRQKSNKKKKTTVYFVTQFRYLS